MPKEKINLKEVNIVDLNEQLVTEKRHLQMLTFTHAVTPLENHSQIKHSRRAIAKIITEINQRNQ